MKNLFFYIFFLVFLHFSRIFSGKINLALNQFANQSSMYIQGDKHFPADGAIDGLFISNLYHGKYCSHTLQNFRPWLLVVLEKARIIRQIRILNRHSSLNRLSQLFIKTKLEAETYVTDYDTNYKVFAHMSELLADSSSKTFISDTPHLARTVLFFLDKNDSLTICEIEMWSIKNIDKNKTTYMNSDYIGLSEYTGGYAFDDKSNGEFDYYIKCSHTDNGAHNWWKVDLQKNLTIFVVSVIGRTSYSYRLKDVNIDVADIDRIPFPNQQPKCGKIPGEAPSYFTINCPQWTVGQYVEIIKVNPSDHEALTLCEVDIFGYEIGKKFKFQLFVVNEIAYFIQNSTKEIDCDGMIREIFDISRYNFKSVRIEVKGVGLIETYKKKSFSIVASNDKHVKDLNICEMIKEENGYSTSPDMFDICTFNCQIDSKTINLLTIFYRENIDIITKEIYIFLPI